jgi:hypothetical protein
MRKVGITINWKTILAGITSVFFFFVLIGFLIFKYSKETVAFVEIKQGEENYGYKIERNRFSDGLEIEFWNTRGFKFAYFGHNSLLRELKQEKWLSNQRAIFLDLVISEQEDSIYPLRPTKILFDFKRGEIYVSSTAKLWRNGEREIQRKDYDWTNKDWMTEEEFQKVLERCDE